MKRGITMLNKRAIIVVILFIFLIAAVFDLMNQGAGYELLPQFLKDVSDSIFRN